MTDPVTIKLTEEMLRLEKMIKLRLEKMIKALEERIEFLESRI